MSVVHLHGMQSWHVSDIGRVVIVVTPLHAFGRWRPLAVMHPVLAIRIRLMLAFWYKVAIVVAWLLRGAVRPRVHELISTQVHELISRMQGVLIPMVTRSWCAQGCTEEHDHGHRD